MGQELQRGGSCFSLARMTSVKPREEVITPVYGLGTHADPVSPKHGFLSALLRGTAREHQSWVRHRGRRGADRMLHGSNVCRGRCDKRTSGTFKNPKRADTGQYTAEGGGGLLIRLTGASALILISY